MAARPWAARSLFFNKLLGNLGTSFFRTVFTGGLPRESASLNPTDFGGYVDAPREYQDWPDRPGRQDLPTAHASLPDTELPLAITAWLVLECRHN